MLLDAFTLIERGRRVVAGMGGAAKMPLSLHEIGPYLDRFEPPIPEHDFVYAILRMDNAVLENG